MPNAFGHLVHEPEWIETADGEVSCIHTPSDVGSLKQTGDVVACFDQRAQVRMDCLHEPKVVCDVFDHVQSVDERLPLGIGERAAGIPAETGHNSGHEELAATFSKQSGCVSCNACRLAALEGIVQY